MYLTDRLPSSAYDIDDSILGSNSKKNIKSMNGYSNFISDTKNTYTQGSSKLTKANTSSDSQSLLPHIKLK